MENFLKVEQNFMSKFQAALETIEILFHGGAGGGGRGVDGFTPRVAKGLKLKVRKFLGLISTFVEVTGERLVGAAILTLRPEKS